ncbi:MAG: hypothetical protein JNL58_30000, partial [Planctomyces sp.]|nr:hypothetical protein [Planctomyces sp.]
MASTYDNLNRPQTTQDPGPGSKTITLTYDKVSQRSAMDVPDVGRVTYTHDPARQLTRLKNG